MRPRARIPQRLISTLWVKTHRAESYCPVRTKLHAEPGFLGKKFETAKLAGTRLRYLRFAIECHCKGSKLANGKFRVRLALAPNIGEPN
jgi:hypothetical protein